MVQQYMNGMLSWLGGVFGLVSMGSKALKEPPK